MSDPFGDLNALALWDFEIHAFGADDTLVIRGSRDLSYYHNAEIRFVGVEYVELPTRFSHARFRPASADETAALRRRVEFEGTAFGIVQEADSTEAVVRYVVAASVRVDLATVRHDVDAPERRS